MRYALIQNGKVVQIQPNEQDKFIKVADGIHCGMTYNGTAFTQPVVVKTIEQLQAEAISAMEIVVITECRSGTGKLYFKDLNSAARHSSEIQTDSEIRDRAVSLLKWDIAIDAYALSVVFDIESGGDIPTIESFIEGLPKI
jgi:protein tyrosine phosphatase (PTP) superfamily phosphohydrolase (DUF442 family)